MAAAEQKDEVEEVDEFTKDRTLDRLGKPAVRTATGGWKASLFILGNQGLACASLYGVAVNLVLYLTRIMHEGNSSAANGVSNWTGTLYFCSLIGGFVGDAYLGRYLATLYFQLIYFIGSVLVSVSATLPSMRPPHCDNGSPDCKRATAGQRGLLYSSLYIMDLGSGGYQPNILTFGADQFDEEHPVEKLQKDGFFNWFYLSLTLGTLFSTTVLAYIENEGKWALGFWISTGVGIVAFVTFLAGTGWYRYHKTAGNPLSRTAQVIVAASRKWAVKPPSDSALLYEVADKESAIKGSRKILHTKNFRFLDKAATITDHNKMHTASEMNPWKLCTVTQVEEVKWLCRMIPIWACTIFYSAVYTQVYSLFVVQGAAMNTRLGHFNIPPAALYALDCLSVAFWIFVYNFLIAPAARRYAGHPKGMTGLQRIGTGMPIIMVAMVIAGLVEIKRLSIAKEHGMLDNTVDQVPMSVLWLIPQYVIVGLSETFTYIGQMEFFYDQAPDGIRSVGGSLSQASVAIGNYVSSLLVTIVAKLSTRGGRLGWIPDEKLNRGHLDYFYWLLAILTLLNFLFFLFCAHWYQYTRQDAGKDPAEAA